MCWEPQKFVGSQGSQCERKKYRYGVDRGIKKLYRNGLELEISLYLLGIKYVYAHTFVCAHEFVGM